MSQHSGRDQRWFRVRRQVLRRDGEVCFACGHGQALEVDHILPAAGHPELKYTLSNLRASHGTSCPCPICGCKINATRKRSNGQAVKPKRARISTVPREVPVDYRTVVVLTDAQRCETCKQSAGPGGVMPSRCWAGSCGGQDGGASSDGD